MSGSICLRCLARPVVGTLEQTSLRATLQATAAFSTSAALEANSAVKKKTVSVAKPGRGANASFNNKAQGKIKGKQQGGRTGKPPAEGERKAMRKRVVLSNTNAVEVQGLDNFSAANIYDAALEGQVMGLSNEVIDALRATEAFKATQGWSLFRRPATLVRKETAELAKLMQDVEANKTAVRRVIYGERGSGKSVLALQAKAMALLKGWIVVHIPEAKELILGNSSYAPSSEAGLYNQPHFTAALLSQIAKANHTVLSKLRLSLDHKFSIPIQSNISLDRFAMMGATDPELAPEIYTALWKELTAKSGTGEGMQRPPVVFTVDGVAHVMKESAYMSPDVTPIHAHDLSIVNHFFSLLNGKAKLPNGGMVLATDSGSNKPTIPGFEHAVARNAALAKGQQAPQWDPWVKVDQRTIDVLNGVDVWQIKGLSREEARSIMEYYAKSGMLRQTVNDTLVAEKWTLSGGGIIGELEKGTVKTRI
ncbi:hypothetical protein M436DRAFT_83595 [Aureobasidium namibiae CBS 147.97]|uniref:Small ribosomal subunit protein mS29 n=1 Tax=Aureobasidium namibiae CBS 147.97 TaxID=1043004 RepID=A0A074WI60_9PEZI